MSKFKPVVVVHPDGREHTASSEVEFSNLVYGAGYTIKTDEQPVQVDEPAAREEG
jgi:hypothetical protein